MINSFYKKPKRKNGNSGYYITNIMTSAIALALVGCGDSSTSAVKELYVDDSMTMTTSQLLDNRKICEDVTWNNFEDQHKRTVVEYKCTFINTTDFLAKKRELYINNQNIALNERIKTLKDNIKDYEEKITNLTNNGEKIAEEKLGQISYEPITTSDHLAKLTQVADQLNKVKDNYNDNDFINLIISNDFQSTIGRLSSADYKSNLLQVFKDTIGPFSAQVGWMQREKTSIGRENYKKENVDRYLQVMRNHIDDLAIYLNEQIANENKDIERKKVTVQPS